MLIGVGVFLGADEDGRGAGGSGEEFPSVAVFLSGDRWVVRDNNTDEPDGYVVTRDDGASFVIDTEASSGLPLTIVDGCPYITYP